MVKKIAFIGGGNMAEAIIRRLIAADASLEICVAEISAPRREELGRLFAGIQIVEDAVEAARCGDVIVLSVKPQQASGVLDALESVIGDDKLLISIMAGIPTSKIEASLAAGSRIIRAMPNTPALVGSGATAVCPGRKAGDADLETALWLFSLTGVAVRVEEKQMDAVTGLSGSGPAYVFTFIESLADAGVKNGLPRDVATRLAVQTVLGAAQMVAETGEHPALLRERVTSPGGTTIAGLHALENGGFRGVVMNAVDAASLRSRELAGK